MPYYLFEHRKGGGNGYLWLVKKGGLPKNIVY